MNTKTKLRVWWIPQLPMNPFRVNVNSVEDAVLLLNTLADYDAFQFKNNVKPDYCNVGGIEVFDNGGWEDWYDPETGETDPLVYIQNKTVTNNA